jgi:hypothetical protein
MKKIFVFAVLAIAALTCTTRAQWAQTDGPYGSIISCFGADGSNVYAGTMYSGVFRTTDNGTTWQGLNANLPIGAYSIFSIVASGTKLFIGTDGAGVYLTTDNGATWTERNNGLSDKTIGGLTIRGSTMFCGGASGLYRSTNDGESWTFSYSSPGVVITSETDLYFLSSFENTNQANDLFISTDNGDVWTKTSGEINTRFAYSFATIDTQIFISGNSGIFRSSDKGESWVQLSTTHTMSLAVVGTDLFAGTSTGINISTDNGATWTSTGYTDWAQKLTATSTNLFVGYQGIHRSSDKGTTWGEANSGLTGYGMLSLLVSGEHVYAGSDFNLYVTSDNGANWKSGTGTAGAVYCLEADGSNLYAGTEYPGEVYQSIDNGLTWNSSLLVSSPVYAFTKNATGVFAGSFGKGVSLTTDDGASWNEVNDGLTGGLINALVSNGPNIFAGWWNVGIFLSTDNGMSWSKSSTGLTNAKIFCFATIGSNIFVGTDGGVFLSSNNGANWEKVNTGLTTPATYCLAVSGTTLFAGTLGGGVFLTRNNGATWEDVHTGFPDGAYIYSLAANATDLFAGTYAGVWKRPLSDFGGSVVNNTDPIANAIELSPNPTNGIVTITRIPSDAVSIAVINVLGETMLTKEIKSDDLTVDLSNYARGTYYVRFISAQSTVTKTVILK